jgi:aliphatic nitrilase
VSAVLRAALVQAAPVFLDLDATTDKACRLIQEAADAGARLVVFGEGFLPGHPVWAHVLAPTDPASIALATRLVRNAVTIPSPQVEALAEVARRTEFMVLMGIVERPDPAASVIHGAQLVIAPDGTVAVRRKLTPAVGERVILTPGGGPDIRVFDSAWGAVSALIAGENANPLLTAALRGLGAGIHVASWPPHFNAPGIMPETLSVTGRAVAYQNTAHVLVVSSVSDARTVETIARDDAEHAKLTALATDATSFVVAPRGRLLDLPALEGEGMLLADLDLDSGTWAQLVNRQYDRPDLLRLIVDTRAQAPGLVVLEDPSPGQQLADQSVADQSVADQPAPTADRATAARRMILERFGHALSAADVDALVPFVAHGLDDAARLRGMTLSTLDPSTTSLMDSGNR